MSDTVSPEQLAANRADAARSTGPRTPEDKHRSSQNARKHGFTASTFAVVRLESGFFTTCLNESFDTNGVATLPMNSELAADIEIIQAQNRNYLRANGLHRLVRQTNSFALLLRYQAQAERQYRLGHRGIRPPQSPAGRIAERTQFCGTRTN